MKKWILLSVMLGAVTLSGLAQDDDMYFVPTKKNVERERASYGIPTSTYYSGSSRSVDEYNRRWGSSYEVLPADTGDIISFAAVEGVYPDSVSDFSLTKQMARFDGYEPSSAYWAGYNRGFSDSWGWHSPWYYSYYPWYDSWYWDPWYWDSWYYYPYYSGWYYHHYYPWHYGGWYGGGGIAYNTHYYPGTQNHGRISGSGSRGFATGRTHSYSTGTFGSSRSMGSVGTSRGNFNTSRSGSSTTTRTRTSPGTTYSNSYGNFGGSSTSSSAPSRSSGSSYSGGGSSGGGGGSFGGSRSGGGGGGGSRSGGGGGFGGGRR